MPKRESLTIGKRKVSVSSLDKPLYPAAGFTKAAVIDYYIRVSGWLLPHLRKRPVTLKRYPDGVAGEFFYEKDAPSFTPDWVKTVPVPRRGGGTPIRYIVIDDLPTLVWSANLANLEIHPFLHRAPHLDRPTAIVFDLDPGEGAAALECAEVALLLRDTLARLNLESFPKVSGSKGIQVYLPLNTAVTYELTKPLAKTVAELLAREHPAKIVSKMSKAVRGGKVFIDWSQNSDFKTTVGVYSLRAKRQTPFVSMPVGWDELEAAVAAKDSGRLYWQPGAAIERLEKIGDLFEPVLKLKQKLPKEFASLLESRPAAKRRPAGKRKTPVSLSKYEQKRDFSKTPEPRPAPRASHQGSRRRFVVQKHEASHLHYDFRLEMHGVLRSWAVPKGVPTIRGVRRLAMATEDHPLEYLDFEGTIPKGQYGGGTVMVWDIGTYELVEGNYFKGSVKIHLDGQRLKGEWTLSRDEAKGANAWMMTKTGAGPKRARKISEDVSALTGRSMEEIASSKDRVWRSHRDLPDLTDLPPAKIEFIEPMRAQLTSTLPVGEGWQYELKFDGYRALALRDDDGIRLLSRNNRRLDAQFSTITEACRALPARSIYDGEIVALDQEGRPSFKLLQNWQSGTGAIVYFVFDLIAFDGKSLRKMPLGDRRALLESVLSNVADPVRLSATLDATPDELIAAARKQSLEGFVAKRTSSLYEAGQRSGAWIKFKVNLGQELVIGGYMPAKQNFESLLVGYYDKGRLMFIGKVRNGFTAASRQNVFRRFSGLGTKTCPFANLPEPRNARRGEALTAEVMRKCCWLKPQLVAQIEFTDWTAANHLRHSRFAGMREDKDPREVAHETAA